MRDAAPGSPTASGGRFGGRHTQEGACDRSGTPSGDADPRRATPTQPSTASRRRFEIEYGAVGPEPRSVAAVHADSFSPPALDGLEPPVGQFIGEG